MMGKSRGNSNDVVLVAHRLCHPARNIAIEHKFQEGGGGGGGGM